MFRKKWTIIFTIIFIFISSLIYSGAHISNFHARAENNSVILEWSTESESNVARFDIQRSMDKIYWLKIGSISSKSSNSNTRQNYQYIDNTIFKGNASAHNYRLIVVDQNGQSEIFSVIASVSGSSGIKRTWGSLKAMFR